MGAKLVIGVLILFSGACILWAQEKQKPGEKTSLPAVGQTTKAECSHIYKIGPEDAARPNPVRFTEASVVRGRRIYFYECAMCHGQKGDGNGMVALMPTSCRDTLPDFTQAHTLKDRTDGDLFAILSQGSDTMPGLEKVLEEKQRWDLINFLRATGGRVPEKSTGPETEENMRVIWQDSQSKRRWTNANHRVETFDTGRARRSVRPIASVEQLRSAVAQLKPGDSAVLRIERNGQFQYLGFEME